MTSSVLLKKSMPRLGLWLATLLLSACSIDIIGSDRVYQDDIHQSYDVTYSAKSQVTQVEATFRLGGSTGTTVELHLPSKLLINDQVPTNEKFLGSRYRSTLPYGFQPHITTTWTTQNGLTYVNNFEIKSVSAASVLPNQISLHTTTKIGVVAPNYSPTERIGAVLEQTTETDHRFNYIWITQFDAQKMQVTLTANDLANFSPGAATLWLRRASSLPLQQKTPKGGIGTVTYDDIPVSIILTE